MQDCWICDNYRYCDKEILSMEYDVMKNYLSHLTNILNIDFVLYENDELMNSFSSVGDPFSLRSHLIELMNDKPLFVLNCEPEIGIAKVPVVNTPYTIYIGPCLTIQKNEHTTQNMLTYFDLPSSSFQELNAYISSLPFIKFNSLLSIAISLYEALNNSIPDFIKSYSLDLSATVHKSTIPTQFKISDLGLSTRERSYQFEEKLKFLISNGFTEDLSNINNFSDMSSAASQIATGTLRQLKNCVEILITISSRAAMAGGLPPIIAYDLSDIYYLKAENAATIEELYATSANIPFAFAAKVRDFKGFTTDNYIVKKCVRYIYENLSKKITLDDIANAVGTSPTYISSQFSNEFDMTIPHFIKSCRVRYAEYLLRFSEHSLVEIANILSFSSQSAFQNAFKEIVGMTPKEYKAANLI